MFEFLKRKRSDAIDVNDLDSLIGKAEIIDIREPQEYRSGSIKGTRSVPMGKLLEDPEKYLNKDRTYYIMCQSGMRSKSATRLLLQQGFNVIHVTGGMGTYGGANAIRR